MKPNELALVATEPNQLQAAPGLSIEQVFRAVVEKNVSPENISVMKELLAMDAERKFNAAFVALQSEMPVIVATSIIPNRGKYERFEDLMKVIGPLLTRHGFTVSFSQDFKDNRTIETCHLSHAGGHSRSNSFAVRVGGRSDSDTQADCKASTTAKRNAFCNALNVVIRQDCLNEENDAGIEGDPNAFVTEDQAFEIERRANECHADIPALLTYAKARRFAEIPANRYDEIDRLLRRKEAVKR